MLMVIGALRGLFIGVYANAVALRAAGSVFNRFFGPEIDLENLEVIPSLKLSSPYESRLPLRWIAVLNGKVNASLAANSGIHDAQSVLKMIMAGADVAQIATVLIQKGAGYISTMLSEMKQWMEEKEYESVHQMKGSMSQKSCDNPSAFERANYMKAITTPPTLP